MVNKMKKSIRIISIFILFLIVSCGDDENIKLEDFGHGYYLDNGSDGYKELVGPRSNIIIFGPILEYNYNKKYIIVKEKPRRKIDTLYHLRDIENLTEEDKAFDKIKYYDYWILDMINDSIYGPFQKKEFYIKINELGVPDSLLKMNKIIY